MTGWPSLPYHEWRDTRDTLHRWLQIVGKVRLALTPLINHWWNVPFYVSTRGLTTSSIAIGDRRFEVEFDFIDHILRVKPQDHRARYVELAPRSVADFYRATMAALRDIDVEVAIWTTPVEIAERTPFEQDRDHCSYDPRYVRRFWEILSRAETVLTKFRAGFTGKCSPVHFFWGSMDLAVSRFSGRRAPPFEGDMLNREAYSHEVSSVGWWPGDYRLERASFYSYAAPEPPGFADASIDVPHAYYHQGLKGFYLDQDDLRRAIDPDQRLLDFCGRTYAAAAELGSWSRSELERTPPKLEEHHGYVFPSGDQRQRTGEDERLRGVSETRR